MTRDEITLLASDSGMVVNLDAQATNALGRSVPVAWIERFATLVEARSAGVAVALLQAKDAQIEALKTDARRYRCLKSHVQALGPDEFQDPINSADDWEKHVDNLIAEQDRTAAMKGTPT